MNIIILVLIAAVCGVYDQKYHKIPNFLTFSGITYGLLCCKQENWKITVTVLIILFLIGLLGVAGMGDIKLWMMTMCMVGLTGLIVIILVSEVLFIIDQYRTKKEQTKDTIKAMFFDVFTHKRFVVYEQEKTPYGMYFFIGSVMYLLLTAFLGGFSC